MVRLPLGVSRCGNTPNLAPAGDTVAVRRRSAVDAQAHRTLGLTLVLLLAQGVPLVVLLLAAGEGDEDLGTPPDEVQLQRDDRVTLLPGACQGDRKSTRLNSSHVAISYAVFCLKNKK